MVYKNCSGVCIFTVELRIGFLFLTLLAVLVRYPLKNVHLKTIVTLLNFRKLDDACAKVEVSVKAENK